MALIIVTTGTDETTANGLISLREALGIAAGSAGADTITFASSVSTVDLGAGGPLVVAAGQNVTISGDRDGDGIADVVIDGNTLTSHFLVAAGATATFQSLLLNRGNGVSNVGTALPTPGTDGSIGANGQYTVGANGGDGANGGTGGVASASARGAGSIVNFGTVNLVRSQFFNNSGSASDGGDGGDGGAGGTGGMGANGPASATYRAFSGFNGGDGGNGGNGGRGGVGGDAAGVVFNAAGATLTLVDTSMSRYVNFAGQTLSIVGNVARAGDGGDGGDAGAGGSGGYGGRGGYGTTFGGNGGNGGDGGNGGKGGAGGAGGGSFGAILNLGTIVSANHQVVSDNTAYGTSGGYGGAGGQAGSAGFFGLGGVGYISPGLDGYAGNPGTAGQAGAFGAGISGVAGIANRGAGTGSVAVSDTIYYIYSPTAAINEGTGGSKTFSFFINRVGTADESASINWSVANVSGISSADFAGGLPFGQVNFGVGGVNSVKVTLDIATDSTAEFNDVFTVKLTSVSDVPGGPSQGLGTSSITATIVNDDRLVSRYSSNSFATLVETYTAANAFAQALADATANQAIDINADALLGNVGAQTVNDNNLTIRGDSAFDAVLTLGGTVATITLASTASIDVNGNASANVIIGNSGANRLDGKGGIDQLFGKAGDDVYVVDVSGDKAFEANGEGNDTVFSAVTYSVADQFIENLTLTGTGTIDATGNSLANILRGNVKGNTLDGKGGIDQMFGGLGNDTYVVDQVGDKAFEVNGEGTDLVKSSVSYSIADQFIENILLTGTGAFGATGNSLANILTGNGAGNRLSGKAGNDTLEGKGGSDTFIFSTALGATNVDHIVDFTAADTIELDKQIFSAISGSGVMTSAKFKANPAGIATDDTDRIVYDTDNGNLFYDADGNGAGTAVLFAVLDGHPTLGYDDFFLV